MKIIILLLVLLNISNTFASSLDANVFDNHSNEYQVLTKDKVKIIGHGITPSDKKLNNFILNAVQINKEILNSYILDININSWIKTDITPLSFSNAKNDNCNIDIAYDQKLTPLLLQNIDKDVLFITTHEISHCILGKKIFKDGIEWKYDLSYTQKQKLNILLDKKTNIQLKNFKNKKATILPLVIYHEMFADTFAIIWLYSNNQFSLEDIKSLIKERENQYFLKNETTAYLSFLPLKSLLTIIQNSPNYLNNKSFEDQYDITVLLIQKSFIEYLTENK